MAVVLCPCSLASALIENLHWYLGVNTGLFLLLLVLFRTTDTQTMRRVQRKGTRLSDVLQYPLFD